MRLARLTWMAACAVLAFGAARAAEPVTIHVGYVVPISDLPSMLMEKKELAKHLGQSYRLEVTRFAGTPPMVTALASGSVDIADLAFTTLPIAIQNAGLSDLRVIADGFQDGVAGHYSNQYMVLNDGPIKKVADMKGHIVASNATGSGVDIAMRAMLRKSGLEDKRDYTVIEAPFPTMKAMLTEKKVDLVSAVLPFALDPALRKVAHPLFDAHDAVGVSQFTMWTARQAFIDKNRAAMVDFVEDALRILRWYLDPANQKEVMEICARITKQPAERFSWAYTAKDYFRDPNLLPNLEALQHNVDLTRDLGFIKSSLEVAKFSDLSLAKEAAARLK
ncbi:MAG TPA: ABC transporter substrate-binding protein [Xanthobacteraceae bacterium]|nr:ABC transporter substrate-binding protein [Xanthobacteraceae bacterium]